jgi:O-antigen/teichoic acid export membrane protein
MAHIASRQQFSRNLSSGWVLLAAEVAVGFALTPFVIRSLGATQYGLWAVMLSLVGYMGLVDMGIRGSVGRYVNHHLARGDLKALDEVVGTSNVVLTALAALALAVAFLLAGHFERVFPKTPPALVDEVRLCLPLLALGLWVSFIGSIQGNLLAAKEANYLANRVNLAALLLRAAATVWVLWQGLGLVALVVVAIATNAVGALLTWTAARRLFGTEMPRLAGFAAVRLQEMWRFGIASFAVRTSSTLAADAAPVIGMWVLGPEAVAVYSVAMTLTQYARRLIDQAGTAIFPSVMKAGALRDHAGLRDVYLRFMNIAFAVGSLVFVGMMVFSHAFIGLWVGPQYQQGAVVVAILCLGLLMQAVASTAPLSLAALDRIGITVKIAFAEAAACVVLTATLPSVFGLGLAGLALGVTLPRLVTACAVYPALAVASLGSELRRPLWRTVVINLALCCVVALLFAIVAMLVPGRTWPSLIAAVAVVTVLHVTLLGHRYEVAAAGRAHELVFGRCRRWLRERRA